MRRKDLFNREVLGLREPRKLSGEEGYDVHRLCENTRKWAAAHPHCDRMVHTAEELRQLVAEKERERGKESAMTLNDEPPRKP